MSDHGVKLPIIIHIGQQFKKNSIINQLHKSMKNNQI